MKKGISSIGIAGAFTIALVGWMLSGLLVADESDAAEQQEQEAKRFRVQAEWIDDMEVIPIVDAHGRTVANREVQIRSQITGQIVSLPVVRGSFVSEGEELVRVDARDREERFSGAEARVQQLQLEAEAARRLAAQGLQSDSAVAAAQAELEAAKAALAQARIDLERTRVLAPFEGWIADRDVEVGDYVQPGESIARIVDLDPIIVQGFVTEKEVAGLEVGQVGTARLASGDILQGKLRYISPVANDQSRMFRVELEVPNSSGAIRAGLTAAIEIPRPSVRGHKVAPGSLRLSDEGKLGVMTADDAGYARFHQVTIIRTTPEGFYVSGLKGRVALITVGKDFVRDGEQVEVVMTKEQEAQ